MLAMKMLSFLLERFMAPRSDEPGIPFRVRLGVTGHRELEDETSIAFRLGRVLEVIEHEILAGSAVTPVVYTVVSSLAEGADRLVSRIVLERAGAELEVVLPLELEDFLDDFDTPESRAEFMDLVGRATGPPSEPKHPQPRPAAYATGGYELVDRVDILVAVWNTEPTRGEGGTGAIVDYARAQRVPTFIVSTVDPERLDCPPLPAETRPTRGPRLLDQLDLRLGRPRETPRLELLCDSFEQLDRFNRERLAPSRAEAEQDAARRSVAPAAKRLGIDAEFADWMLAPFVRADQLASLYQWVYTRLAFLVFIFAALAVTAAAGQFIYLKEHQGALYAEVGLVAAVFTLVLGARWKRPKERWVSYRSLAENLRSAPFIAFIRSKSVERELDVALQRELGVDPLDPWFQRAFTELWRHRPAVPDHSRDPQLLGEFFDQAWIEAQITYHRSTSARFNRYHHLLTLVIHALFVGTFVAALCHAAGLIERNGLVLLAISLPAFGAALGGYRELRQFALHSERFRRAKERLRQARTRMLRETDLDQVSQCASRAYTVMFEENLDWFGVREFQDLDLVP
jgi:hypothetical protein